MWLICRGTIFLSIAPTRKIVELCGMASVILQQYLSYCGGWKIYQGHIKLLEGLLQSIKCDAKVMVEFIRKAKKSVINRTQCLKLAVLLPSVVFND